MNSPLIAQCSVCRRACVACRVDKGSSAGKKVALLTPSLNSFGGDSSVVIDEAIDHMQYGGHRRLLIEALEFITTIRGLKVKEHLLIKAPKEKGLMIKRVK